MNTSQSTGSESLCNDTTQACAGKGASSLSLQAGIQLTTSGAEPFRLPTASMS